MEVGAGRRQRVDQRAEPSGYGMVGTTHADGRRSGTIAEGDVDAIPPREDDRQTTRPEAGHQHPGPLVDLGQALGLLDAVDEHG